MVQRLTDIISRALNRPVQESIVQACIDFYKKNHSIEAFSLYCGAFGLKDQSVVAEIHQEIAQNISTLVVQPNNVVGAKKKDNSKRIIAFDEDIETLPIVDNKPQVKKSKPLFKKLKRERSEQLKQERAKNIPETIIDTHETPVDGNSRKPKSLSLAELASHERNTQHQNFKKNPDLIIETALLEVEDLSDVDTLVNDREWYMAEEGPMIVDYDDNYEGPNEYVGSKSTSSTQGFTLQETNRRSQQSQFSTGGLYNASGEYIDYDHDSNKPSDDLSRMALTTHTLVPPFLEDYSEHLSVVLTNIGPSVNPVKEPTSELALTARKGSAIVKERKADTEKAKQARERSNLAGTMLGNVLGIKTDKDVETKQKPTIIEEKVDPISILEQRRSLPAFSVRQDLLKVIRDNQVTIVIGETGSGKTTQLTQFLYEDGFAKSDNKKGFKLIGCTQPRRVAAVSVAQRVSQEMGVRVGTQCGYTIRFEDKTSPNTVIKYLTEGILLREVLEDPRLERYSCIIMDEAHERLLNTDVLLGLFKQVLSQRRDLKLIVTSATLNADRFSRFFGDAPQFTIPGRTFPVEVMYSRSSVSDYVEASIKQVLAIHVDKSNHHDGRHNGDILVFMTGQEDVETTCEILQSRLEELDGAKPLDIYPIYSTLPGDLQQKIFAKSDPLRRKCVVATNIAETSLTVDGVRYVVDCGLSKVKVFNPRLGMDALQVVPISYANAQQRSGRAGRTSSGVAYRMYTERASEPLQMYVQPVPEIQRTNLATVVLLLRSLRVRDIMSFPFLDPPPRDLLACSLYDLWAMGALDSLGELTLLGRKMNPFPMDPAMAKLILKSLDYGCSEEILTIIAMLQVPSVWYRPRERAKESDAARERFQVTSLDHLSLYNVFTQWDRLPPSKRLQWCSKNFLHHKLLLRAREVFQQLSLILSKMGHKLQRSSELNDYEIVRKCICSAFFHQAAKLSKLNHNRSAEYFHLRHSFMKMFVHPTSALNGDISPLYVVYNELILTSREYMSCVTAVDPLWLVELGSLFYGVPKNLQPLVEEAGVQVRSKEQLKKELEETKEQWIGRSKESSLKKKKPTTVQGKPSIRRGF